MVKFQVKESLNFGGGRGLFAKEPIREGETVIVESPFVIGPKQSSSLICVECLCLIDSLEPPVCKLCGVPLCSKCSKLEHLSLHQEECELFQAKAKHFQIKSIENARKLFCLLTPLRLLLKKVDDQNFEFCSNLEARKNTLLHIFNEASVARPLYQLLEPLISKEDVHEICGILDSNCYDINIGSRQARALYKTISNINHNCSPNSFKYFDKDNQMIVVASRNINPGEEIFLSYTPALMSTPVRQVTQNVNDALVLSLI